MCSWEHKGSKAVKTKLEGLGNFSLFVDVHACMVTDGLNFVHVVTLGSAEKLFNLCVEFAADSSKKKIQIMPLQNTVLILCPVSFH